MKKKVSAIIACYKDERAIPLMAERLGVVFTKLDVDCEMIFVNDGSPDNSQEVLEELAVRDPRIKVITHSRNFGSQNAFTSGLRRASGDACILLDGDLQDPPEIIEKFHEKWLEGHDVVYGIRVKRAMPWAWELTYKGFYRLFQRVSYIRVPLDAGDFSLLDRKVVDALKQVRELHRFVRGLTCWVGFSQTAVRYERAPRHAGVTKYPIWKLMRLAWDGVTSFSSAPLRWMTLIGLLVSIAGLAQAVRVIVGRLLYPGTMERGWATLVAIMLFLGGVQLISLGLIGQYVGRIFEESKKRPLYFVKETVGLAEPREAGR